MEGQIQSWPNPVELPLYVTVQKAADIAGVSYEQMKDWVEDAFDPLPHIVVGRKKKLIRTSALPGYLMGKERKC